MSSGEELKLELAINFSKSTSFSWSSLVGVMFGLDIVGEDADIYSSKAQFL